MRLKQEPLENNIMNFTGHTVSLNTFNSYPLNENAIFFQSTLTKIMKISRFSKSTTNIPLHLIRGEFVGASCRVADRSSNVTLCAQSLALIIAEFIFNGFPPNTILQWLYATSHKRILLSLLTLLFPRLVSEGFLIATYKILNLFNSMIPLYFPIINSTHCITPY